MVLVLSLIMSNLQFILFCLLLNNLLLAGIGFWIRCLLTPAGIFLHGCFGVTSGYYVVAGCGVLAGFSFGIGPEKHCHLLWLSKPQILFSFVISNTSSLTPQPKKKKQSTNQKKISVQILILSLGSLCCFRTKPAPFSSKQRGNYFWYILMAKTSLPPGFRFHPTDLELVWYYLKRKIMGKPFRFESISELELYKFAPWDLPGNCFLQFLCCFASTLMCARVCSFHLLFRKQISLKSNLWIPR